MHAAVAWRLAYDSGAQLATQEQLSLIASAGPALEAQCAREHVGSWMDGRKRFEGLPGSPTVQLHFTAWDLNENTDPGLISDYGLRGSGFSDGDCYALDIRVELPGSSIASQTANTTVSRVRQGRRTSFRVDLAGVGRTSGAAAIADAKDTGALLKTDVDIGVPSAVSSANVYSPHRRFR
ncbi:uncharacterized protein TRAVEDRAFT_26151 [Trametes versicolor FP-101664 SS1]|uniref:uncharacterized protein n=1 Tax=Trametes versicolor (strain FP-101664) TaxID=717944 RepID=UPI00046223B4|nr:uncharacterized protein TRAVEDRAFT_26151 [Trametes versicolor FP-101664 SS1]EIW65331.1 hypothetical protein TRAVEDRAFT_26151 [Trametes versicolor FP-101664 SS1]